MRQESKQLDVKLEKFFTVVRKKDDLDYVPDSLQVILESLAGK